MASDPITEPRPPAGPAAPPQERLRYFAWLYSPPQLQRFIQTLFAIENEIRETVRPGLDHHVAHVRLEWWREELERLGSGNAVHPLTRVLTSHSGRPHAPEIDGLLDTAVWDLASATFGTRKELAGYCERWASALIQPIASAALGSSESSQAIGTASLALGSALREIELLDHLVSDARSGRLRIPVDELEQAGVDPKALAKPPWPAKLCAILKSRHATLRAALSAGTANLGSEQQPAMRGLLVWAALARQQSLRAERALPDTTHPTRGSLLREVWSAWRAARRASRGTFHLA